MIGELLRDRRAMRRRPLRHGDARAARRVRAHLGHRAAALLADARRAAVRERSPGLHCSWPRSTGTSNGRCSSRASTTPTTSACTTGCATGHARPVREHLHAGLDYQDHLARFLENHDEPRAAATFEPDEHRAAAVVTFFAPGLRFFHQGQFEGREARISMHLGRGPDEATDRLRSLLRPLARLS